MSFEAVLAWLGLKKWAIIGGFFGALASLRLFDNLTTLQKFTTVGFGWACAAFLTPLAADMVGAGEEHLGSAGFLVGLLGLSIAYNLIKALPEWIAGAKSAILGRLGGGQR